MAIVRRHSTCAYLGYGQGQRPCLVEWSYQQGARIAHFRISAAWAEKGTHCATRHFGCCNQRGSRFVTACIFARELRRRCWLLLGGTGRILHTGHSGRAFVVRPGAVQTYCVVV